jgi:hypothetical protein
VTGQETWNPTLGSDISLEMLLLELDRRDLRMSAPVTKNGYTVVLSIEQTDVLIGKNVMLLYPELSNLSLPQHYRLCSS